MVVVVLGGWWGCCTSRDRRRCCGGTAPLPPIRPASPPQRRTTPSPQPTSVGDHVCLTPEDPGAPPYLARLVSAFEDLQQQGGDRLCIEVGGVWWGGGVYTRGQQVQH